MHSWSFISKILIREAKRLQHVRDPVGAAALEQDVETVINALRVFGLRYNIASMQAMRADRFRKGTLDEYAFMEGDAFDESAQVGVERVTDAARP